MTWWVGAVTEKQPQIFRLRFAPLKMTAALRLCRN